MGINCKYSGGNNQSEKVLKLLESEVLIPVCPEQLGGLATPRDPAEIKGGRVVTKLGNDVTDNFERGAEAVLQIAKLYGIKEAILKEGSPSCGSSKIYDGTFLGNKIEGSGKTAELLRKNEIKVISENDL